MIARTLYIVLLITLVLFAYPNNSYTQVALSEGDVALVVTGFVSILGCGLFSLINTLDLITDDSDKWSGGLGTFFGVTLISTIAISESQHDGEVNDSALMFGSLAITSITLGIWSIIEASRVSPQVGLEPWTVNPIVVYSESEPAIGGQLVINW